MSALTVNCHKERTGGLVIVSVRGDVFYERLGPELKRCKIEVGRNADVAGIINGAGGLPDGILVSATGVGDVLDVRGTAGEPGHVLVYH